MLTQSTPVTWYEISKGLQFRERDDSHAKGLGYLQHWDGRVVVEARRIAASMGHSQYSSTVGEDEQTHGMS